MKRHTNHMRGMQPCALCVQRAAKRIARNRMISLQRARRQWRCEWPQNEPVLARFVIARADYEKMLQKGLL